MASEHSSTTSVHSVERKMSVQIEMAGRETKEEEEEKQLSRRSISIQKPTETNNNKHEYKCIVCTHKLELAENPKYERKRCGECRFTVKTKLFYCASCDSHQCLACINQYESKPIDEETEIRNQIKNRTDTINGDPDNQSLYESYHERCELYLRSVKYDNASQYEDGLKKALEDAEKMVQLKGGLGFDAYMLKADVLLAKKEYPIDESVFKEVDKLYQTAMEKCGNKMDEYGNKIQEKLSELEQYYDELKTVDDGICFYNECKWLPDEVNRISSEEFQDKIQKAIVCYDKVIKSAHNSYADCYYHRCAAYMLNNQFEEALDDIQHYIEMRPKWENGYAILAEILVAEKQKYAEIKSAFSHTETEYFRDRIVDNASNVFQENWSGLILVFIYVFSLWTQWNVLSSYFSVMLLFVMVSATAFLKRSCWFVLVNNLAGKQYFDLWKWIFPNDLDLAGKQYALYVVSCPLILNGEYYYVYLTLYPNATDRIRCNYDEPLSDGFCFYYIAYYEHVMIVSICIAFVFASILSYWKNKPDFMRKKRVSEKELTDNFSGSEDLLILFQDIKNDKKQMQINKQCFGKHCQMPCDYHDHRCYCNCKPCTCNLTTIYAFLMFLISVLIAFAPLIIALLNGFYENVEYDGDTTSWKWWIPLVAFNSILALFGLGLLFTTLYRIIYRLNQMDEIMKIIANPIDVKSLKDIEQWWNVQQFVLKWELPVIYQQLQFGVVPLFICTILLTLWLFISIFFDLSWTDDGTDEPLYNDLFSTTSEPYNDAWKLSTSIQFIRELPQRRYSTIFALATPVAMIMSWIVFGALIRPYKQQQEHIKMLKKELLQLKFKQNSNNFISDDIVTELFTKTGDLSNKEKELKDNWIMMNALENMIEFCEQHPIYPSVMGTTLNGNSVTVFQGYLVAILIAFTGKVLSSQLTK